MNPLMFGAWTIWDLFLFHVVTLTLAAIDYVTKWVEALPTKHADAATSLKMIKGIILPKFGVPKILITDGGSHFIQGIFGKVLYVRGNSPSIFSISSTN